jgi:diguanylate cyclase
MPARTPQPTERRQGAGEALSDIVAAHRARDLRFVKRIHLLRTLGLGLGFLCVASVFRLHHEPLALWAALVAHGFAWPHIARLLAIRSDDPARVERRSLALDSALGGVWVALMQFSLLPSALLVTMLCVDKIGVGGFRFALKLTAGLVAACVLTSALRGFAVDLRSPMSVIVACIPFLVAYPMAIAHVMHMLANKVARQNRRLMEISQTDELTGLANRREGLAAATRELSRHRRNGGPAVLIVLDIDRFKEINDRYGHPAGDEILRAVALLLRKSSRATDTPARYAGDEFLLVLPETDLEGAAEMAKRIREQLAAASFERAPDYHCTVSLGAAEAHDEMADVEDWIQQADAALYRAKAAGRDRMVCAPRIAVSPLAAVG